MSLRKELNKALNLFVSMLNWDSLSNPSKPKISANIICHNNIKSIEACLKSMEGVVDEFVVVDGGSTDGTLDVLKKYNCKIITNTDWQGYSHQRNLAIKESTGDWIIKMDSDEILSQELRANLRKLCASKIYSGYKVHSRWVENLANMNGGDLQFIDHGPFKGRYKSIMRIFRNLPSAEFTGVIHESTAGLERHRVKKFSRDKNYIYHLDVAINTYDSRLDKVQKREAIQKNSGHPEEYLPENYELKAEKVPSSDLEYLKLLKV